MTSNFKTMLAVAASTLALAACGGSAEVASPGEGGFGNGGSGGGDTGGGGGLSAATRVVKLAVDPECPVCSR